MSFIRVRSKGGPDAEYDIGVEEATANPDLYEVIDSEPVDSSRPATYPETAPRAVRATRPRASRARKPAAPSAAPEPSVGDTPKENKS